MARSVCLPVGAPWVQGYLFYAYPLSILAGRGDACLPWLLSTFIQLYHLPGRELKFYLHPLCPGPCLRHSCLSTCPWLDVQSIDQRLLGRSRLLALFLRHCLEDGLYPQIDVDYARLDGGRLDAGGLPGAERAPFLHEVLVTGYDAPSRTFAIARYDGRGRFRPEAVFAADLERAAAAAEALAAGPGRAPDPDWLARGRAERPRLFLYRYVADADFAFDAAAVSEQLWDYAEAANSSCRHRAVAPPVDGLWGLAVYAYLATALQWRREHPAAADALAIPLRILWEHKGLMARRLAFLERGGFVDPALALSGRACRLAADAQRLRLVLLRGAREGRPEASAAAIDGLQSLAAAECDLLGDTLDRLAAPRRAAPACAA